MRKNILHLIFLVFLLVLGVGSNADEPSGPITIVGVDNIAPFSFLLSNGEPSGLYVEFWQLWSSTNNIPIKIELGAFNDGMKKAKKAGSVHAGLFINESRSQWASFSRPIHYVNTGFIYNSSFPENTKLRDLVGVKVGAHRGTFQSEYLINNMPNLDLVLYDDTPDSIDDLLDNKIVALVAEVPFLQSRIERRGLNGVFMFGTEILLGNTVHAAVAKGQPELLSKLNEGIKKIPVNKLIDLERKWLPTVKPFYNEIASFGSLTMEETEWLQEHQSFSLGVETTWYPFEFVNDQGEFIGIVSDYVDYASAYLGVSFRHVNDITWSEAFEKLKAGDIDVMSGLVFNPERAKVIDFTDPYFEIPGVIVVRQDSFYVESLKDLRYKRAGIVRGYILVDSVSKDYPDIDIIEVDSVADGLDKVKSGEIDAYIGAIAVVNYEINRRQLTGLSIAASTPYRFQLSMGVRKGLGPLVSILNKTFASMTERQKSSIANNWLSVHVKVGTDIKMVLFWVLPLLSFSILIILLFVKINRRLTKEISRREEAEKEHRALESHLYKSQKAEALG